MAEFSASARLVNQLSLSSLRSVACINKFSLPIFNNIFFALELMRNCSAKTTKPFSWLRLLILTSRSVGVIKSAPLKREIFSICEEDKND